MDGKSKSKVDPLGVCSLRIKANSALCLQCSKWIPGRCAGMKMVLQSIREISHVWEKCEGNIGEAVKQEVKLCDEVETVSEFTYLGYRGSAVGGSEAAVTVRTRYGWAKHRECGYLLYGRRFPLDLKGTVYNSYARSAIEEKHGA